MPTARDFDDKLTVYKEVVQPEMSKDGEKSEEGSERRVEWPSY